MILDNNSVITHSVYTNNEAVELNDMSYKTNCHTICHRAPDILPTFENSADDLDNLDDVYYILFLIFLLKF